MPNSQPTILLIEEDDLLRSITGFRLELLGYRVVEHPTGESAWEWLQQELPSIILVGHHLPGMEGADLIDRLSNDIRTSELPVMLMSPNSDLDDVQRAFNAGADEYLVTPYDPLVLERKINRLAGAAQESAAV